MADIQIAVLVLVPCGFRRVMGMLFENGRVAAGQSASVHTLHRALATNLLALNICSVPLARASPTHRDSSVRSCSRLVWFSSHLSFAQEAGDMPRAPHMSRCLECGSSRLITMCHVTHRARVLWILTFHLACKSSDIAISYIGSEWPHTGPNTHTNKDSGPTRK